MVGSFNLPDPNLHSTPGPCAACPPCGAPPPQTPPTPPTHPYRNTSEKEKKIKKVLPQELRFWPSEEASPLHPHTQKQKPGFHFSFCTLKPGVTKPKQSQICYGLLVHEYLQSEVNLLFLEFVATCFHDLGLNTKIWDNCMNYFKRVEGVETHTFYCPFNENISLFFPLLILKPIWFNLFKNNPHAEIYFFSIR